jgi:hypothetical protein
MLFRTNTRASGDIVAVIVAAVPAPHICRVERDVLAAFDRRTALRVTAALIE